MEKIIAQCWYERNTLHTRLVRDTDVIHEFNQEVDPDYLIAKLINLASRGYAVRTQNFRVTINREKKYER